MEHESVSMCKEQENGTTLQMAAASLGELNIVKCLVYKRDDVCDVVVCNTTALPEAASRGEVEVVAHLLHEAAMMSSMGEECFVNHRDFRGETSLFKAVERRHHDVIKMLLKHGADVNLGDVTGYSPLHCAVRISDTHIVDILLASAAKIDAKDVLGNSPLHLSSNAAMTTKLLEHGADKDARNRLGRTPLHFATSRGSLDQVSALLNAGADPNVADEYGNTALHVVCDGIGKPTNSIVELLVKFGGDVNARNARGLTPLHTAGILQKLEIARALVDNGADCSAVDSFGVSPIFYFVREPTDLSRGTNTGSTGIRLLTERGADCNAASRVNGKTPLHVACTNVTVRRDGLSMLFEKTENTLAEDSLGNTPAHYRPDIFPWSNGIDHKRTGNCPHVYQQNRCGLSVYLMDAKRGELSKVSCIANDKDKMGRTALHLYCSDTPIHDVCKLLLTGDQTGKIYRPMLGSRDVLLRTPIHHMCIAKPPFLEELNSFSSWRNSNEFEEQLLKNVINLRDIFGRTALHYAVIHKQNQSDFIEILLAAGADPDIADNDGVTPKHLAEAFTAAEHRQSLQCAKCEGEQQVPVFVVNVFNDDDQRAESLSETNIPGLLTFVTNTTNAANGSHYESVARSAANTFVTNLMNKVVEVDKRFASEQPLLAGSSMEGTRTELPPEYDFLVVLSAFGDALKTEEHEDFPGYVRFRAKTKPDEFRELCDEDGILQPNLIKERLYTAIIEAANHPDVWLDGVFEYLSLKVENQVAAITITVKPNRLRHVNVTFFYSYGGLSIDIVPAICADITLPKCTHFAAYAGERCPDADARPLAIMKPPKYSFGKETNGLCATSFTMLEARIIRDCPAAVKTSYALLKHNALRDTGLQKYALKTCVLHCLVSGTFDALKLNINVATKDAVTACIRVILGRLWACVLDDAVTNIASPNRLLPVWESEPMACFFRHYLSSFCLSYCSCADDPYFDSLSVARSFPGAVEIIDREFHRNSRKMGEFLESFRKQFATLTATCERFGMECDVTGNDGRLQLPERDAAIWRYVASYNDYFIDFYWKEITKLHATEPEYVTTNDFYDCSRYVFINGESVAALFGLE